MCALCAPPAATPTEDMRAGRLREDLYYRLFVIPLTMPPLRARGTDIHMLAQYYLAQIAAEEGKRFSRFSPDVLDLFLTLPWHGNVRELINVLRHAVVLHDGEVVTRAMLPHNLANLPDPNQVPPHSAERRPVRRVDHGPDRRARDHGGHFAPWRICAARRARTGHRAFDHLPQARAMGQGIGPRMRSVLITGCSSGIGHHAAHALAARGWQVLATCRKPDDCARLCAEGLDSFPLDLTDTASIHAALAQTLDRTGGRLDALFNNGAFALPGAVEDLPTEGLRALFETNLFGWHELTRAVLPLMRAQGHGRIVQNSSVLGLAALKWRGAYVASKFALEGLSDVMRLELAGTGIHVALIEPGPITSRIRENSIPHFERWIDWENSPPRRAIPWQPAGAAI